jgi:adenosylhomocysteine nucleosidase
MRTALLALLVACATPKPAPKAVVIVSANMEWKAVKALHPDARYEPSPWGEWFEHTIDGARVVMFHGGWGKVAAAGSAQYAIDRWAPRYVINLGTAGGFAGAIAKHAVVLVDRTVIYDIKEAMGDSAQAIADYSTTIDLGWLTPPYPSPVTKTLLVSADRDLVPGELATLASTYHAVAGDWESGAIAYTCARNQQRLVILRGISDLVTDQSGEVYGNLDGFVEGARVVMTQLIGELPRWLDRMP